MGAGSPRHMLPLEAPSISDLIRRADEAGALAEALPALPPEVAGALRAIAAGERISGPLTAEDITLLGRTVAAWDAPAGRCSLSPWGPRFSTADLIERLGLSPETAERVAAVVGWPVGFMTGDFVDWAALSNDEAARLMDYLASTHGLYATGTKYAAP